MTLLESVRSICERLAGGGWHELLLHHGVDILAPDLAAELGRPLTVDRSVIGFEDFSQSGCRGIEPGNPGRSLLYHALASPNVTTNIDTAPLSLYPSADETETVLNYVYAARGASLADIQALAGSDALAVVMFAKEYRPRDSSVHRKHADLCFSRTGLSRVGTAVALYHPELRGFLPVDDDDPKAIRVMPVRFAAYLAVQRKGGAGNLGLRTSQTNAASDADLDFWVPLHKLFDSPECLTNVDVQLAFETYHVNDKLRQFHLRHPEDAWGEPAISHFPFLMTEGLATWHESPGLGCGEVLPEPHACLVEMANYNGQPAFFSIPQNPNFQGYIINRRHQLCDNGEILDLNTLPDVEDRVNAGGYRAVHFIDFTAEGWVRARCPALESAVPLSVAGYSIVAAPDFFPEVRQRALVEWSEQQDFSNDIWNNSVKALSDIRAAGNPGLAGHPFELEDKTVTALVAHDVEEQEPATMGGGAAAKRASCLADAAAGTFSPGWDIASDGQGFTPKFFCGYNLGSPFTEDIRICSAMGGYWPAVTPDTSRTFEPRVYMSVIPLTDDESGQTDTPSWDGVQGPQLLNVEDRQVVQYTAFAHTDYTRNALDGQLLLWKTARAGLDDYYDRIVSMQMVYAALGAANKDQKREWAVLSFTAVARPDEELEHAEQESGRVLAGPTHRYQIYRHGIQTIPADVTKRHVEIEEMAYLFVGQKVLLIKRGDSPWQAEDIV